MGTQYFIVTIDGVQPLKKCESLYWTPVIYIIVYNYTLIKKELKKEDKEQKQKSKCDHATALLSPFFLY